MINQFENNELIETLKENQGRIEAAREVGWDSFVDEIVSLTNETTHKSNSLVKQRMREDRWETILSIGGGLIGLIVVGALCFIVYHGLRIATSQHYLASKAIADKLGAVEIQDGVEWSSQGVDYTLVDCSDDEYATIEGESTYVDYRPCKIQAYGDVTTAREIYFQTYDFEMNPLEVGSIIVPPFTEYTVLELKVPENIPYGSWWIKSLSEFKEIEEYRKFDDHYIYEDGRIVSDRNGTFSIQYDEGGKIIGFKIN